MLKIKLHWEYTQDKITCHNNKNFPICAQYVESRQSLQQILILCSFIPLSFHLAVTIPSTHVLLTGKIWMIFDPLLSQPISGSDFRNTISTCHPQFYSCGALSKLMAEGDLCNQKTTSEWVWPWWKLSSLGKLLLKAPSPQLGNISNLKMKGSLTNPSHISDECANDLSTISLKFLFISSTGKETSWDAVS